MSIYQRTASQETRRRRGRYTSQEKHEDVDVDIPTRNHVPARKREDVEVDIPARKAPRRRSRYTSQPKAPRRQGRYTHRDAPRTSQKPPRISQGAPRERRRYTSQQSSKTRKSIYQPPARKLEDADVGVPPKNVYRQGLPFLCLNLPWTTLVLKSNVTIPAAMYGQTAR